MQETDIYTVERRKAKRFGIAESINFTTIFNNDDILYNNLMVRDFNTDCSGAKIQLKYFSGKIQRHNTAIFKFYDLHSDYSEFQNIILQLEGIIRWSAYDQKHNLTQIGIHFIGTGPKEQEIVNNLIDINIPL